MGSGGGTRRVAAAPGEREGRVLRSGGGGRVASHRRGAAGPLRRLCAADRRPRAVRLAAGRVHAARHLQPGEPREARLPRRSLARCAGTLAASGPAGRGHEGGRRRVSAGAAAIPAAGHPAPRAVSDGAAIAAAIDVRGLTKRYGERKVVDGFTLRVERGSIVGFLGPNGSGKTTTIRMLCGLLTPDGGEGTCLGHDLESEAEAIKREVGYMTQRFSLYEDLSIA